VAGDGFESKDVFGSEAAVFRDVDSVGVNVAGCDESDRDLVVSADVVSLTFLSFTGAFASPSDFSAALPADAVPDPVAGAGFCALQPKEQLARIKVQDNICD